MLNSLLAVLALLPGDALVAGLDWLPRAWTVSSSGHRAVLAAENVGVLVRQSASDLHVMHMEKVFCWGRVFSTPGASLPAAEMRRNPQLLEQTVLEQCEAKNRTAYASAQVEARLKAMDVRLLEDDSGVQCGRQKFAWTSVEDLRTDAPSNPDFYLTSYVASEPRMPTTEQLLAICFLLPDSAAHFRFASKPGFTVRSVAGGVRVGMAVSRSLVLRCPGWELMVRDVKTGRSLELLSRLVGFGIPKNIESDWTTVGLSLAVLCADRDGIPSWMSGSQDTLLWDSDRPATETAPINRRPPVNFISRRPLDDESSDDEEIVAIIEHALDDLED